jgi:hypothetical protein
MKRRTNEENFEHTIAYCVYINAITDSYELGEFTLQLDELGIQLPKQFERLEQFSIQLEKQ